MSLFKYLEEIVRVSIKECGYNVEETEKSIKLSDRLDLSQFQCNIALAKAKQYKKNPRISCYRTCNYIE